MGPARCARVPVSTAAPEACELHNATLLATPRQGAKQIVEVRNRYSILEDAGDAHSAAEQGVAGKQHGGGGNLSESDSEASGNRPATAGGRPLKAVARQSAHGVDKGSPGAEDEMLVLGRCEGPGGAGDRSGALRLSGTLRATRLCSGKKGHGCRARVPVSTAVPETYAIIDKNRYSILGDAGDTYAAAEQRMTVNQHSGGGNLSELEWGSHNAATEGLGKGRQSFAGADGRR